MFFFIIFWLALAVWIAHGFWPFLPAKLAHVLLSFVLVVLGWKALGNPFTT